MKKINYFLLILLSLFFTRKVLAKTYTIYNFPFQQVTGSYSSPLNFENNLLYFTMENYNNTTATLTFALSEPNKVINADEVRFQLYYNFFDYQDELTGELRVESNPFLKCWSSGTCNEDISYSSVFTFEDNVGIDQAKTSISIQVVQKYTTIVCDITGTQGIGYLSVTCPLTTNRDQIDGFTVYVESTRSLNLSKFGISQYMSVGIDDSTDTITGAINDQTSQLQKNAQQAHADSQQQLQEAQKQTEEAKKQTAFITSDDEPEADISSLGNVQGIFPPGPVDSLLNVPFKFLSVITSSFGGICKPIEVGVWNKVTTQIPCFDSLIYDNAPDWLMVYLDLIPSGFILIVYFKHLYKKIDRASSLETNSDDEWGVL